MDCARASDLLSLYIDEMLDETQAYELQLHLEECALCRAEYEQLTRMRAALLGVPDIPLPDGFDERLRQTLARLSEETPDIVSRRSRRKVRIWVSAAAIFAVGLFSMFVYRNTGSDAFDSGSSTDIVPVSADESVEIAQSEKDISYSGAGSGSEEELAGVVRNEAGAYRDVSGIGDESLSVGAQTQLDGSVHMNAGGTEETPLSYESYDGFLYPARGTTAGAHRLNEKALYDEMLKEKLEGWNYTIISEEKRDGAYVYRVKLISNNDGAIFDQEIEVVASGNVLQILYATEFMGFND
jgi:hypothetical protein